MGSKNHEIVPTALISQISKLKSGGINKILGGLAKRGLVSRVQNAKCEHLFFTCTGLPLGEAGMLLCNHK